MTLPNDLLFFLLFDSVLDNILENNSNNANDTVLPELSPSIPGELTSRRHLKAFKDSGILNFAAVNNSGAGLDVMTGREFCKRYVTPSVKILPTEK